MGELIPVLMALAVILVIVITMYWKKIINTKLSNRSADNDQIIFRQTVTVSSNSIDSMSKRLIEAKAKTEQDNSIQNVDFTISDNYIIRFVIDPKAPEFRT